MSDDVLVRVDNVSKRFCRSLKRSLWYGLHDLGSELGGRRHGGVVGLPQSSADVRLRKDEFWAVKDVSFELRQGECLGLIGRNGAGKTTLLRMLNGLIKPDTGIIDMRGQIGALIALGAGFNPLLTGRENIHINAAILGIDSHRLKKKIDEIIDFSGVERFIDSPVQTYSSGMSVRLGFAIASSLKCQILILDEVLAVGDEEFQLKCFTKISKLIDNEDSCAILVTHQMQNVERICTRAISMNSGKVLLDSNNISEVVESYAAQTASRDPGSPEIIYPPCRIFNICSIEYCPHTCTVLISIGCCDKEISNSLRMIASYSLLQKGSVILSGTTKGTQSETCSIMHGKVLLRLPNQIAQLDNLSLCISFWDAQSKKPLCWIKGIILKPKIQGKSDIKISFA